MFTLIARDSMVDPFDSESRVCTWFEPILDRFGITNRQGAWRIRDFNETGTRGGFVDWWFPTKNEAFAFIQNRLNGTIPISHPTKW